MFVLLMVAGAFALLAVPVERFPPVAFGETIIQTYYPGASPQEVETLVTRKLEEALEDLEDVEFMDATSLRERSIIHLKFRDGADFDNLEDQARFKVLGVLDELPTVVRPPAFFTIDTTHFIPVVVVNLSGERGNRALSVMAKQLRDQLRKIHGVEKVELVGERQREFHLLLDPKRMNRLGVTFEGVATALQNANIALPAGDYHNADGQFTIQVDEKFRSREQVLSTILRRDGDGGWVRLADVITDAHTAYQDPFVLTSVNGNDALSLKIIKSPQGNALNIKREVQAICAEFAPHFAAQGVNVVLTQDSTDKIQDSMQTLGSNLLLGIILVSLIIWYFMGIRAAGLTVIGIPFSFLVTMIFMMLTGNSLNEITLFSFVLVSGIVVDDAIVVVENIYRHIQSGKPMQEAVINGTAEVMLPVISATSTTLAAFLPMLIMSGSTGEFFAQIPKAVSFAIGASLLECLLILPIHYFDFGPRTKSNHADPHGTGDNLWIMAVLHRIALGLVRWALRFRITSVMIVLVLFLGAFLALVLSMSGYAALIRIKFFPDDYAVYFVDLEGPPNVSIEEVNERVKAVSRFIMQDGPGMAESAAGFAGMYVGEDYQDVFGTHYGMVVVTMPVKSAQRFADYPQNDPLAHLDWMRARLSEHFATDDFTLRLHAQKDGPPTGKDLNIRVVGNQPQDLQKVSDEILNLLHNDPQLRGELTEITDDRGKLRQVLRFAINHERTAEYDLSPAQVAMLSASVLDGRFVDKFRFPDEEVDLRLQFAPQALPKPEDALSLPLLESPIGPVRLGDVVRLEYTTETQELHRYQGQSAITISANLKAGTRISTTTVVEKVRRRMAEIRSQYTGASLVFGGAHEDTQRSFQSLAYAFGIAILVMYVILATQFQSYLQPLIILSAVIFSLIGVIFGKMITQSLFTVNSFIAIVGVTGVVVNDSLVLIDFINRAYRSGMTRYQAIEHGIRVRLRPILLTTLTTSLGLLPMALGIPYYSLVWGGMASTFVTGLATATFLTLFIVPVLWDLLEGVTAKKHITKS